MMNQKYTKKPKAVYRIEGKKETLCGTVMCAGGCDYMTFGPVDRPVYCMYCGDKEKK